jgi:undecaprenyl-phosphate 4-deoxy-4-formamido-L-arabinose transferase
MLRAYRRVVVDAMLKCHEHNTFIPILANSFARYTCEIPVSHAAREHGESKYGFMKLVNLMFDLVTTMSTAPLRLLSLFGVAMAMTGFAFGVLLLVLRLAHGPEWAAQGVFVLFAVLFIFTGAQFVGLGLLGEYLGRVYHGVRAHPRFFVEQIVRPPPAALPPPSRSPEIRPQ